MWYVTISGGYKGDDAVPAELTVEYVITKVVGNRLALSVPDAWFI
jgi:hypothetical protein